MNRDEIMRMAQEAGIVVTGEAVWKLCELVAAAEREACAALCDEDKNKLGNENEYLSQFESGCYVTAEFLAEAIRARGNVNER
jgi:hypothetical protein